MLALLDLSMVPQHSGKENMRQANSFQQAHRGERYGQFYPAIFSSARP
jgi:hypothetical protein